MNTRCDAEIPPGIKPSEMDKAIDGVMRFTEHWEAQRSTALAIAVAALDKIARDGGMAHDLRNQAKDALMAIALVTTK